MIRLIALLRAKKGMSAAAFREYYETRHVPLIEGINPYISGYTRDYITPGTAVKGNLADGPGGWAPDYDVITMVTFANEDDLAKAREAFAKPENQAAIAKDEENFLDREAKIIFFADVAGRSPV